LDWAPVMVLAKAMERVTVLGRAQVLAKVQAPASVPEMELVSGLEPEPPKGSDSKLAVLRLQFVWRPEWLTLHKQ